MNKESKDELNNKMNTRKINILTTVIKTTGDLTGIKEQKITTIEEKDTFNFRIDRDLKRKFHIKCMEKGTDMSKVLISFIENYINNE